MTAQLIEVDPMYLLQIFDHLFREAAFSAGEAVTVGDGALRCEVTTVSADGRALEVIFRFADELESGGYRWLKWNRGIQVPFELPAVGQSRDLPAVVVPAP